ncbi:mechanosensitive ion channel domain-containing protein [Pararhizobium mangrovi]|uniref:mechanosensitive ion channel domain-containing protein n=1 Tax=Pararhizobium mangrovi TaxID=2590452 RepID=UPI0015E84D62|nr:mechanosensitive ion channel domain-containing protein [Pararhizobium mangrovi]
MFASALCVAAISPAGAQQAAGSGTAAQSGAGTASGQDGQIQALIDAIKNDATRKKLIDALEKANASDQASTTTGKKADQAREAVEEQDVSSAGRRVAEFTQAIAHRAVLSLTRLGRQAAALPQRLTAFGPGDMSILMRAVRDVGLAILTTYAIFLILRVIAKRIYRRLGGQASNTSVGRMIFLVALSLVIDVVVVLLAWAAGYAITALAFGDFGVVGIRQSLYLNAFVLVELFRVLLRFVLSPSTANLRLVRISDPAAKRLNNRLTWIAFILGYGQLFVAPIVNASVSFAAGQAISVILSLIALAIAVVMTVRGRHAVKGWLLSQTAGHSNHSRFAVFLAQYWYLLALLYFAFLFFVIVTQPAADLLPVLAATGKVLAAIIIGLAITGWIARARKRGVKLPETVTDRLPALENRLNAFVPRFLSIVRILVFLVILGVALDAVGALNYGDWLHSSFGARATGAVVSVLVILLIAFGIWLAFMSWVDFRLNPNFGTVPTQREQTLLTLLRNAATIALIIITLMIALSQVGIDIAPLLASAGVLGLAIGFGAQKLVQDIITGVFIQLENAINVGDVVTADAVTGTAERLTIRSLSIRDLDGTYHIIPFSSVTTVSNFMKGFSYYVNNIGVAYREDIDDVRAALFEAFERLRGNAEYSSLIIGDMEWFGVTTFADSAVIVRSRIKTLAGSQWGIGRAYNGYIKTVFDERNIEIPFPHQTLYFGEGKRGEAPVAHIRVAEDEAPEIGGDARPDMEEKSKNTSAPPIASDPPDNAEADDSVDHSDGTAPGDDAGR